MKAEDKRHGPGPEGHRPLLGVQSAARESVMRALAGKLSLGAEGDLKGIVTHVSELGILTPSHWLGMVKHLGSC